MSSTMTTTLATSNMRTSLRQTRTNPSRTSKTVGSSLRQNSLISNPPAAPPPNVQEHGFYPAITHFTDAITALPREFRRHTSLLKEVDAKAWAPEAHLQTLLAACVTSTPPDSQPDNMQPSPHSTVAIRNPGIQSANTDGTMNSIMDTTSRPSPRSHHDQQSFEHRRIYYHLRTTLSEMMVSMDEKNHLINSANEDLSRHLNRLHTIYPHIADEISEEARLGSLTHWAYIEDKPPTRTNAAGSRKEAAAGLAAMHDTDIASRSESRREAMLARKQRQTQVDSDFDDQRPTKRANANGKSRRAGEIAAEPVPGLGISGAAPTVKRKRAEKPGGGAAMERSLSGILGGRAMSREPSQQEGTKKRKAATAATTAARKRINTANSATNSPKLASSPLVGSFGKDAHKNSPIPGTVRPQSTRARQNSTQGRPPSSASNRNNGNGARKVTASTPELHNVSAVTGKSSDEIRNTMKESVNNKGEKIMEEEVGMLANGTNGMRGGILLERRGSKGGASNYKREEASASEDNTSSSKTKSAASPRVPPQTMPNTNVHSATTSHRPERERDQRPSRARSSKTSTPIVNTFAESDAGTRENHRTDAKFKRPASSSSRSARNKDPLHDSLSPSGLPPKRSHKKGAGLAAQAAALQAKLARQNSNKAESNSTDDHDHKSLENNNANHAISNLKSTSSPTFTSATNNLNHVSSTITTANNHNKVKTPSPPLDSAMESLEIDVEENIRVEEEAEEEEEEAEETLDSSGEEPRYCYCQQVSYGEMVACDADDCPREWFHLECVGLGRAPGRNARWFCEECKERLKVAGNVGGGGNGLVQGQAQGQAPTPAQAQAVGGRRGR